MKCGTCAGDPAGWLRDHGDRCPDCEPETIDIPFRRRAAARIRAAMMEIGRAANDLTIVPGEHPPEYFEINRLWHAAGAVARKLEPRR